MAAPQAIGPGLVDVGFSVASHFHHRCERKVGRGQEFRLPTTIVYQLAGIVGDTNKACMREHRWRSIADLIIELTADEQNDIGFRDGGGTYGGNG